ncbi:MAG: choloylglycine hydrolase family protein [Alphaproteobacteria bacterium]|nr:choloylglycine hydrolase family protein [Alphaproteobacteria bacterium]
MKNYVPVIAIATIISTYGAANACTGITLTADDNSVIAARTVDWSGSKMDNIYVISPRGHTEQSLLPDGTQDGMAFTAKYGFVGLGMQRPEFVVDGTNEAGLNVGLFYFPDFGKYQPYDATYRNKTLADFQVVSWILSQFSTIDEVKNAIDNVRIVNIDPTASTVHWRITEPSGRVVVMEIIDGIPTFYENPIGVIANSPNFDWHMTNLDNYVNLYPGRAGPTQFGPIKLRSLSNGTGLRGLPGDFSSPSRFVRASFLKTYAIPQKTGRDTVMQSFHILNNFDVPFGTSYNIGKATFDMPSATQWTISTDTANHIVYYHTMYNRTLRKIDMNRIDFDTVKFQSHPLDTTESETIIDAPVNW